MRTAVVLLACVLAVPAWGQTSVERLNRQISQLTEMVSLERAENAELSKKVGDLTSQRDSAIDQRDQAHAALSARRQIPPVSCTDDWISFVAKGPLQKDVLVLARKVHVLRGSWVVVKPDDKNGVFPQSTAEVAVLGHRPADRPTFYRVGVVAFSGIAECLLKGKEASWWGAKVVDALLNY